MKHSEEPAGRDGTPRDRRRSARRAADTNWACLAWRERGWTREATARLLDLSGVGAFVVADEAPPVGRVVWLRLEEPTPTGWVEATVVRLVRSRKVAPDFAMHCPPAFLGAAATGSGRAAHVPAPSGFA